MDCKLWLQGRLMVLIVVWLLGASSNAEQRQQSGPYDIHYTALSSMLVPADTALQHGLTRAPNRLLVNIAVRRDALPVNVIVTGEAANLLNQRQPLVFTEVTEQRAIYYLAEVVNHEQDTLRFKVQIQFPTDHPPHELTFTRQYY